MLAVNQVAIGIETDGRSVVAPTPFQHVETVADHGVLAQRPVAHVALKPLPGQFGCDQHYHPLGFPACCYRLRAAGEIQRVLLQLHRL